MYRVFFVKKYLKLILTTFFFSSFIFGCSQDKGLFSDSNICIAAISIISYKPPSIINVDGRDGNIVNLSYRRPSDGTRWEQKCKVSDNKVVWGTRGGRWRTSVHDKKMSFSVAGNDLTLIAVFHDGSKKTKSFNLSELGG